MPKTLKSLGLAPIISLRFERRYESRKEGGGGTDVVGVPRSSLNERGVEHGDPRDLHQQEGDERRSHDGEPTAVGKASRPRPHQSTASPK